MRLSLSELKNLTGLDHRRIAQSLSDLAHETGPKNAKLYESTDALPLLYMGDYLDAQKERARLTHHQANIASLEERERRGELVNRDSVVLEVSESIANAKAKLLNIPSKVCTIAAAMDDAVEIRGVIESAVYEAITELYNEYAGDLEADGGN